MNNQVNHILYIGNLSVITNKDALTNFLNTIAIVVSVDVFLNDNLRSRRCFAIVEILSSSRVDEVVDKLNGTLFQGRVMQVKRKLAVNNLIKKGDKNNE